MDIGNLRDLLEYLDATLFPTDDCLHAFRTLSDQYNAGEPIALQMLADVMNWCVRDHLPTLNQILPMIGAQ